MLFRSLFFEPSWVAVYIGQGIIPQGWDQRADRYTAQELETAEARMVAQVSSAVDAMPDHAEFIRMRNASVEQPA